MPRKQLRDAREPTASCDAPARILETTASRHCGTVEARSAASRRRRRPPGAPRPATRRRRSLRLPRPALRASGRGPGWSRISPLTKVRPSRTKRAKPRSREKSSPSISRVRSCIRAAERRRSRQSERRLARPLPRKPPNRSESSPRARRAARNRARPGARSSRRRARRRKRWASSTKVSGVPARHAEPVQVHHARTVEQDGVATGEEAAHHGLGDTGGKRHRHDRIGRSPTIGEDLGADLGCRGMPPAATPGLMGGVG